MKPVLFIYADDCKDCNKMRIMLNKALEESNANTEIMEYNSDTSIAVNIAVDYGIEDIPACVIGDTILFGKKGFTYKEILKAFKELS